MSYSDVSDLLNGSSWNESDEIWSDELGDTVSIINGITNIDFTRLTSLPSYYTGEDEADTDVFVEISNTSHMWDSIKTVLGQNSKSGFEVFFDDVAKINFNEQAQSGSNVGAITFAGFDRSEISDPIKQTSDGYVHQLPWSSSSDANLAGDLFFDFDPTTSSLGTDIKIDQKFGVIIHEIAHALGLQHPSGLDPSENTTKYTIMVEDGSSIHRHDDMYYDAGEIAIKYSNGLALYDVAAIQEIYGRNYATRSEDTTYDLGHSLAGNSPSTAFTYTIWDGGGTDKIDATGFADGVQIDLRQGHFSSIGKNGNPNGDSVVFDSSGYDAGNVAIAFHTVIENATGSSHNDVLIGNDWGNIINGGAGDDIIYGDGYAYDGDHGFTSIDSSDPNDPNLGKPSSDDDILNGGAGVDTVHGGVGNDILIYNVSENSLFTANDELLYGDAGTDTLKIELTSAELTNALKDDILAAYHDWTVVHTGTEKEYDFSILKLHAYGFENLVVTVDGAVTDLATVAHADEFMLQQNGNASGNLFNDNGFGSDYTFGSGLSATAGTFTTLQGGSIVISNDGSFAFTASTGYSGVDSYTYTVTDSAGSTSTAIVSFDVQVAHVGTNSGETLNYSTATDPVNVSGLDGNDTITGSSYSDYINAGAGNDTVNGGAGNDIIYGGDGNDTLKGNSGNDTIYGGNGDDIIYNSAGVDTLDGGAGTNIFMATGDGSPTQGINLDLLTHVVLNDGFGNAEYIYNFSTIYGTNFGDTIGGDDNRNSIFTGASGGNDVIHAYGGDDTINTYTGDDIIWAGSGNDDIISGVGNDTVYGEAGNDTIYDTQGNDILDGGDGTDTLDLTYIIGSSVRNDDIIVDLRLSSGQVQNDGYGYTDSATNFENIRANDTSNYTHVANLSIDATDDQNVIDARAASGVVNGYGGNDVITASFLNGTVDGGDGNDTISCSSYSTFTFNMTVTGGAGNDSIYLVGTHDIVDGGPGNDTISAGAYDDILIYNVSENVGATDLYYGQAGSDELDIHLQSSDLTSSIVADVFGFQSFIANPGNINVSATTGNQYAFTAFGLTVSCIENLRVYVDNNEIVVGVQTHDDSFAASNSSVFNGNVFIDNGNGADYSFDTSFAALSGTFTTSGNGSVTISSNGDFAYTALTGYSGIDTFTYTLEDSFGHTAIGNVTLDVSSITGGTAGDDTLTGTASGDILYGYGGNDIIDGGAGADTMVGGTGNDTYYVDDSGDVVTEASGEGTDIVYSAIDYTLTANVENLTLLNTGAPINATGNGLDNHIIGNAYDNVIHGGAGNDTLDGGTGSDTMYGGTGDDLYIFDLSSDVAVEYSGEGNDTIMVDADYTLPDNIENLTLYWTYNGHATGNSLDNILTGDEGNNTLDGGLGADTMIGGTGNDIYIVDNAGDTIIEHSGEGTDLVQASVSYALPDNVENITLTGTGDINATGNDDYNTLTGNSGDNVLDGGGGIDTMYGGDGNDTYVVDNPSDYIYDSSGTDTVQSSITYTISSDIENLTLIGIDNIDGTGNSLDNVITGNSGDNVLDGVTGNDTLIGGDGNDTYIYHSGITIIETANHGTDTVESLGTVSSLADNVENIVLTGYYGVNATGNDLDNHITGNSGGNILDGGHGNDYIDGGFGDDTMYGGHGNDTFVVDSAGDVVVEYSNEGTDTIETSVTYTLPDHVENMVISGSAYGTGNDLDNIITDGSGSNFLYGMGGNDTLNGGEGDDTLFGGDGADTMTGGDGNDTFVFEAGTALNNVDTITDFNASHDVINIHDLLSGFTAGTSNIADFVQLTQSGANMTLSIDIDGPGTTYGFQQIATLNGVSGLSASDLYGDGHLIVTS